VRQGLEFAERREPILNRPGMSGDSTSWEGWSHGRWFVEEVSAGAA
jgi:phospholipase C